MKWWRKEKGAGNFSNICFYRESKGGYLNGKIKFVGISIEDPIESIELDLVIFSMLFKQCML